MHSVMLVSEVLSFASCETTYNRRNSSNLAFYVRIEVAYAFLVKSGLLVI